MTTNAAVQKAGALAGLVRARMGKCANPECTHCDTTNAALLQELVYAVGEAALTDPEDGKTDLRHDRDAYRAALALAVVALGGTWVLDARGMPDTAALALELHFQKESIGDLQWRFTTRVMP